MLVLVKKVHTVMSFSAYHAQLKLLKKSLLISHLGKLSVVACRSKPKTTNTMVTEQARKNRELLR